MTSIKQEGNSILEVLVNTPEDIWEVRHEVVLVDGRNSGEFRTFPGLVGVDTRLTSLTNRGEMMRCLDFEHEYLNFEISDFREQTLRMIGIFDISIFIGLKKTQHLEVSICFFTNRGLQGHQNTHSGHE